MIDELPTRVHDARQRALIEVVQMVTIAPWTPTGEHRARWNAAGLTDDDLLHAIAESAYFGHLNRVADAVGVPLDYPVAIEPPRADPTVPPFPTAPAQVTAPFAIEPSRRPATTAALADWRAYLAGKRGPLAPGDRAAIGAWVAAWLGDGPAVPAPAAGTLAADLHALAELVTLAPWQVDDAALAPLRARGLDDAALFDAVAAATSAGMFSRIDVALRALAR